MSPKARQRAPEVALEIQGAKDLQAEEIGVEIFESLVDSIAEYLITVTLK